MDTMYQHADKKKLLLSPFNAQGFAKKPNQQGGGGQGGGQGQGNKGNKGKGANGGGAKGKGNKNKKTFKMSKLACFNP